MMLLNAAPGLNARTSFLALLLAALQGPVPADPSPPPRASSDTDNLFPGMGTLGMSSESDSRTTRDRNTLSSALLDREGLPVPHRPPHTCSSAWRGRGPPPFRDRAPRPPPSSPWSGPRAAPPARAGRRRRRRRSKALDSSDPLCLHTQRGECSLNQEDPPPQPEADPPEHAHAVSKETIASTSDDPLNVVQPPEGAGSPRSVATDKALTKKRTAAEEKEVQA
ncbi:hypothetical protein COCON_G00228770 [Conger conger]|uniref:Uncharacterized protein n=1 Tax=Conger conger TaxID=82655 RepID=A0A9Q1HMV8_CONCO|nr:hypothetical protein COCON_G00228770 [Conger conger]